MFTFANKSKQLFRNMTATILLGGNMGNRQAYLKFALFHISKDIGQVEKLSPVYETAAWGDASTKPFLNQVALIATSLTPKELLIKLLEVEKKAGRTRAVKWGNRTLDLDILFCEQQVIEEPDLEVPHPEIANRKFVLVPLVAINENFTHPILGKSMHELLLDCKDDLAVTKYIEKRV